MLNLYLILIFERWDDMFMTFTALFIVSLGFVNTHAREMRNRHPPFLIFPPVLHSCVCVYAVIVFYFQPWPPL